MYPDFLTIVFLLGSLLVDLELVLGLLVLGGELPLLGDLCVLDALELLTVFLLSGSVDFVSDFSSTSSAVVSMASLDESETGFPESDPPLSLARGTGAGFLAERD